MGPESRHWLSRAFAFAFACAVAPLWVGACTASPCESSTPEQATPALECPGGSLCYRGQCVKACSAGQERVTECSSDSQCSAPRSQCVDGFCSACLATETCIPALNLCGFAHEVALPDPAPRPALDGLELPPAPREDMSIEGGLVFPLDEETEVPASDIAHLASVDVGHLVDGASNEVSVVAFVGVVDERTSTVPVELRRGPYNIEADPGSPGGQGVLLRTEESDVEVSGDCRLVKQRVFRAIPGTDLGKFLLRSASGYANAVQSPAEWTFQAASGRYALTLPSALPASLLSFSTPEESQYVALTGTGRAGLAEPWPEGGESSYRKFLVFEMNPDAATRSLLSATLVVDAGQPADLAVGWVREAASLHSTRWRVTLRVVGRSHEIVCRLTERLEGSGNQLRIPAALLRRFALADDAIGRTARLELERSDEVEQQVRAVGENYLRMIHRLRHGFVGRVTFR